MEFRLYRSDCQFAEHYSDAPFVGEDLKFNITHVLTMCEDGEPVQVGAFNGDRMVVGVTIHSIGERVWAIETSAGALSFKDRASADNIVDKYYSAIQYMHECAGV